MCSVRPPLRRRQKNGIIVITINSGCWKIAASYLPICKAIIPVIAFAKWHFLSNHLIHGNRLKYRGAALVTQYYNLSLIWQPIMAVKAFQSGTGTIMTCFIDILLYQK